MYLPAHFTESRADEMHRLIAAHPFGILVTRSTDGLDADHLPFAFDAAAGGHGVLTSHVARANPVWEKCLDDDPVLVIFRGPEAYISPNWYPSKHETHRQVPTWNYQVVHAHGTLHIHHDEKFLRGIVGRLTRTHEERTGEERPWRMADAPHDYMNAMLAAIVGLEIRITRLEGKSKLGQNKETRDRENVARVLRERGDADLANAMTRSLAADK